FPTQTQVADEATITSVDVDAGGAATIDISLEAGFTTASVPVTTASVTPKVSIAAANLVYIRRSAEKRKDKGKSIMKEDESIQKKTKKKLEQERLGHEEAIRLQEHINEEENQRIARDAEIAKYDPAVLRYHALQNRSFFVAEILDLYLKEFGIKIILLFLRILRLKKEVMKRTGFNFQQKSSEKRSRKDSDKDNAKKQKLKDDDEKKELRDNMDVVPRDDIAIDVESLATEYPIVD
ncbi:hypothetical protein Tco_1256127, partial [Tanacetum coccineum]